MKLNLLYYKNILDRVFAQFCKDYNDFFTKVGEDYVLSRGFTKHQINKVLQNYIIDELKRHIKPAKVLRSDIYFIIGSCFPASNFFLKYKLSNVYFPAKLEKFIQDNPNIKYVLKEKDIKVDISAINDIVCQIFNKMFTNRKYILKLIGSEYSNVFFVTNNQLDCYAMFKTIKMLYGKTNCINIYKQNFLEDEIQPFIAVNELIDKYIGNKQHIFQSNCFQKISAEVKQYIDSCLNKQI